ncbi:MAG: DUF1428 domain-containing protein [Sphingopyxis terrae]|nr:DUF1428 domain-containing protein [Sphingopyxis terrae]
MTYVEGFVLAVPANAKDAYREHAADAVALFKEFGVRRHVECWGDDVPVGKVNDFRTAVQAKEGEEIMGDPRRQAMGAAMPFDGQRMIVAGFASIVEEGLGGPMGYTDGFVVAVPTANRDAYRALAEKAAVVFLDHGATRVLECWGNDVPDGKVTDYRRAVHAEADENVVFSWIEWPDKETRVAGWDKIMADDRMRHDPADQCFDGKRMIYGGFAPILDA